MTTKIIKNILLFILVPNGTFFYAFYLNDFFNIDLFNIKKIASLNLDLNELKNIIKEEQTLSNKKLTNIDKTSSNSNNILIYLSSIILLFLILLLGFNFFNDNEGGTSKIIVENVAEQSKSISSLVNKNNNTLLKQNNTESNVLVKLLGENQKSVDSSIIETGRLIKEINQSQNTFIANENISIKTFLSEKFVILNTYFYQNIESKLILLNNKINIISNNIDKLVNHLIDGSSITSTPEQKPTPYLWGSGESVSGVKINENIAHVDNNITPPTLNPKKLKFDET